MTKKYAINKYTQNNSMSSKTKLLYKIFDTITTLSLKIKNTDNQRLVIDSSYRIIEIIDTTIDSIIPDNDISKKLIELLISARKHTLHGIYKKEYNEEFNTIAIEFEKLKTLFSASKE